jgi:hypothetical protein
VDVRQTVILVTLGVTVVVLVTVVAGCVQVTFFNLLLAKNGT